MTDERWEEVKNIIKDKFQILDERVEELPKEKGLGTIEIIEFINPLGKMKLERTSQPLVIDKKTLGSRRVGSFTKVEYVYSDTERVHKFKAFLWDDRTNDWKELEKERENFFI